jgi:hypothetical protein
MGNILKPGMTIFDPRYLREVPEETVIKQVNYEREWRKIADNRFMRNDGAVHGWDSFNASQYMVKAIPNLSPIEEQESLTQFKWRFMEEALFAAVSHSISLEPVYRALGRLGAHPKDFEIGPGVLFRANNELLNLLPTTTVIRVGEPDWDNNEWSMYIRDTTGWRQLLGKGSIDYARAAVIVSIGNSEVKPRWLTEPKGSEDEIDDFRAKAIRIGVRAKSQTGWCGEFENAMRRVGIDPNRPEMVRIGGHRIGTRSDDLHVANALPDGTISFYTAGRGFILYKTDRAASRNRYHTMRVYSTPGMRITESHYATGMVIQSAPGDPLDLEVNSQHCWDTLPVGTTFGLPGSTGIFIKVRAGGGAGFSSCESMTPNVIPERMQWRMGYSNYPKIILYSIPGIAEATNG